MISDSIIRPAIISLWLQHLSFHVEVRPGRHVIRRYVCKPHLILKEEEYGLGILVLSTDIFRISSHLDALFHMTARMLTTTTTAATKKQRTKSFKKYQVPTTNGYLLNCPCGQVVKFCLLFELQIRKANQYNFFVISGSFKRVVNLQ